MRPHSLLARANWQETPSKPGFARIICQLARGLRALVAWVYKLEPPEEPAGASETLPAAAADVTLRD